MPVQCVASIKPRGKLCSLQCTLGGRERHSEEKDEIIVTGAGGKSIICEEVDTAAAN